jgi:uncharacterized repeat protein (TIGR01451 family)
MSSSFPASALDFAVRRFDAARQQALVLAVAAAALVPSTVLAGAEALVTTVVDPLADAVTITSPTSVGYRVDVSNTGGSTASNVSFTATLPAGATNITVSQGGPSCTVANTTALTCALGQLRALQPFPTFFIYFDVPATPGPVTFQGITYYAEGNGPNAKPENSSGGWLNIVTVGGVNGTNASALVAPKAVGGPTQFVAVATTFADSFSTSVGVPRASEHALAHIAEGQPDGCTSNALVSCHESALDIKLQTVTSLFAPYLEIELHLDKSQILKGTQIGSVLIRYTADDGTVTILNDVSCPNETTPLPGGVPCLAKATHYKSKSIPGWTPALDGDMVWKFLNMGNGVYRVH